MQHESLFTRKVFTADPADSLAEVISIMDKHNVGAVVVTKEKRPVGIVTDRDIAIALGKRNLTPRSAVQDIMTCPVITLNHKDGILQATQKIKQTAARRLPVVDDAGCLVGLVTLDDLILLLNRELGNLTDAIRAEAKVST